jgi:hypothetical protein
MMNMLNIAITLVLCHLLGDYVLQTDFLAKTKGENWYHLFAHCALYCLPFFICFGVDWRLAVIFGIHIVVDAFKARYKKIGYAADQALHYLALLVYLL